MAPGAKAGEGEEAAETQQHSFTETDVSQMHEKVRELAQHYFPDTDVREHALGELDSELQEISGLQERGDHLQGALEELQQEEEAEEEAEAEGSGGYGVPYLKGCFRPSVFSAYDTSF